MVLAIEARRVVEAIQLPLVGLGAADHNEAHARELDDAAWLGNRAKILIKVLSLTVISRRA